VPCVGNRNCSRATGGGSPEEQRQNEECIIAINTIAELLSYFDSSGDKFKTWEKQVRLLKTTYHLNDDMARF